MAVRFLDLGNVFKNADLAFCLQFMALFFGLTILPKTLIFLVRLPCMRFDVWIFKMLVVASVWFSFAY